MKRKLLILTSLFCTFGIFIHLSCGRDCPVCPKAPTPGSYYVYIADDNQDWPVYIWVVDSRTDSLIDSILSPDDNISKMETSPDGKYLAILALASDSVFIFDLDTKEIVAAFPSGLPYFSPDGKYLIIADLSYDRLYKVSVSDWAIIDSDTMTYSPLGIYNNSYLFFGRISVAEYVLYNYELMQTIKIDTLLRPDGSLIGFKNIITSIDDRYFYFTSGSNKVFKYDIEANALVDSQFIMYGGYRGDMISTPDGKYLLISESNQWPDLPEGSLLIIEQEDFSFYRRISTLGLNLFYPGQVLLPGQIAVTPDGSKAFCADNGGMATPMSFNLLDLTASNIKGLRFLCSAWDVAVGKAIE